MRSVKDDGDQKKQLMKTFFDKNQFIHFIKSAIYTINILRIRNNLFCKL